MFWRKQHTQTRRKPVSQGYSLKYSVYAQVRNVEMEKWKPIQSQTNQKNQDGPFKDFGESWSFYKAIIPRSVLRQGKSHRDTHDENEVWKN
jgi:hypothetical protein